MAGSKKVKQVKKLKGIKKNSRSDRAELKFPVGRIDRLLRKGKYAQRIGSDAPVYLGAVLEYITSELLELAGNMAIDDVNSITPYYLNMAILLDADLKKLFNGVTIPEGGVLPGVHPALLHPKRKLLDYFNMHNYLS